MRAGQLRSMDLCAPAVPVAQLAHLMGVCLPLALPEQLAVRHLWLVVLWPSAHTAHHASLRQSSWWFPCFWHLWHRDRQWPGLAFSKRHVLLNIQIPPSGIEMLPGMAMMSVPCLRVFKDSGQFIHLGACARETPTAFRNLSASKLDTCGMVVVPTCDGKSWMTHFDNLLFA